MSEAGHGRGGDHHDPENKRIALLYLLNNTTEESQQ